MANAATKPDSAKAGSRPATERTVNSPVTGEKLVIERASAAEMMTKAPVLRKLIACQAQCLKIEQPGHDEAAHHSEDHAAAGSTEASTGTSKAEPGTLDNANLIEDDMQREPRARGS